MIQLRFGLSNPFFSGEYPIRYRYWDWKIAENKSLEVQMTQHPPYDLVEVFLDLNWRGKDHAGPEIRIGLWKWELSIKVYDHRHWNYKSWEWESKNKH